MQAFDDVLNGSQGAGGEDLGALVIGVGGIDGARFGPLQRSETADADASEGVVLDVVDGRVQHLLVVGELLERAHAGAGADDGDQVAGLHLAVDVLLERLADVDDAFEGEAEVIDHQGDGAADLFRTGGNGRRRGWRFGAFDNGRGLGGGRARHAFPGVDEGEVGDDLRFAVLEDDEVFLSEVGDRLVLGIHDLGVHLHQVDGDADDGVRRLRLEGARGGSLRGGRGDGEEKDSD